MNTAEDCDSSRPAILIQDGCRTKGAPCCCNTKPVLREPQDGDRVKSTRPVLNLHDFFRRVGRVNFTHKRVESSSNYILDFI